MNTVTIGRRPTLGEVIEYYTGSGFLHCLRQTCAVRPVAMIVSTSRHWAPRWDQDVVPIWNEQRLGQYIVERIRYELPSLSDRDRPEFYPSFHQMTGRWTGALGAEAVSAKKPPRTCEQDCVFEADLASWQESFQDVLPVLALMDKHGVRYQHKFSGHRSLHVTLPGPAIPRVLRGKGAKCILEQLQRWYGCKAHYLSQITRMPYSLNEDTGLVCLPVRRGSLESFRPWQAILHVAEIGDDWQESLEQQDESCVGSFLDELAQIASTDTPRERSVFAAWDRNEIIPYYQNRLRELAHHPDGVACSWLSGDQVLDERALQDLLACGRIDDRWLAVEAFLLYGKQLSTQTSLQLMSRADEYVRAAAMDVLLRFEETLYDCTMELLGDLTDYPPATLALSVLLSRSETFRERVLEGLQRPDISPDALAVAACAVGAMTGDWSSAFSLLAPAGDAALPSDRELTLLHAVHLLSTFGGWDPEIGWHPGDEAEKQRAVVALGSVVVDLLLIAAASPNELFRDGVVSALAQTGDARAAGILVGYLGSGSSDMRWKATSGLVRIGEAAVDLLLEAAASDQSVVRLHALLCLGRIGIPKTKDALLAGLEDDDTSVRRQALKSLVGLALPRDIACLEQAMCDEGWQNALLAAEVVWRIEPEGEGRLQQMALQERSLPAAYALAVHGDARGRDVLAEALPTGDESGNDAVEYLRELRDERCVPFLARQLENAKGQQGRSIAEVLGEIGGLAAREALVHALVHKDTLVRRGAIAALSQRSAPVLVEPLTASFCREENKKNLDLVAHALERSGERGGEALRQALQQGRLEGKARQSLAKRVLWRLGMEADA